MRLRRGSDWRGSGVVSSRLLFTVFSWCALGWLATPAPTTAAATTSVAVRPLSAHSHNDYERPHPLTTALALGFRSIEADVHLIAGELHVAHELPAALEPTRTLDRLYLAPLAAHLRSQGQVAFPGTDTPLFLMIDIKGPADASYVRLVELLTPYADLLSPPPTEAMWAVLQSRGVDLPNADDLPRLAHLLTSQAGSRESR